jgi:hypothetical protein
MRRDILRRNYNTGQYWLEIQMNDLTLFDETLGDILERRPADYIGIVSEMIDMSGIIISYMYVDKVYEVCIMDFLQG